MKTALILFLLFFAATGTTVVLSQISTKLNVHRITPQTIGDYESLQGDPIDGPTGPH